MEQRSLAGYGPWGCKESDMTQHTRTHTQDVMLAMNFALCHLISNGLTFQKRIFFKLEYDCFAMLLVSTVQQSESDTHTHTYTHTYTPSLSQLPPIPSYHPSRSWQSPEQSSLGYTTASPYLFHTWLCIMSVLLPIHPTLSLLHVHKSILYVCIFIPTLQIGLSSDPFF